MMPGLPRLSVLALGCSLLVCLLLWHLWRDADRRADEAERTAALTRQESAATRAAVALQERGGISLAWLRRYAALAGYEAKVTEYREFKAGHSAAGDALTNGGWCHAFLVTAPGDAPREFKAGQSVADEALRTWGDPILECIINWRKPAHTVGLVAYIEE